MSNEGSNAEVGQLITGIKIDSFLTPEMASKNDARHGIGLTYHWTNLCHVSGLASGLPTTEQIYAMSGIVFWRHVWRQKACLFSCWTRTFGFDSTYYLDQKATYSSWNCASLLTANKRCHTWYWVILNLFYLHDVIGCTTLTFFHSWTNMQHHPVAVVTTRLLFLQSVIHWNFIFIYLFI